MRIDQLIEVIKDVAREKDKKDQKTGKTLTGKKAEPINTDVDLISIQQSR